MSARRTSYGKVARERDKKAKAAAKRDQRQSRGSDAANEDQSTAPEAQASEPEMSMPELLELVEQIHQRYDAGLMSYDEFEEQKSDVLARLRVD